MLREDFVADLEWLAPRLVASSQVTLPAGTLPTDRLDDLSEALVRALDKVRDRASNLLDIHLKTVQDSPLLSKVSLFRSIGMVRQETVHTSTLAWLLDPRQPHGFGSKLCQAFVRAVHLEEEDDQAREIQQRIIDDQSEVTSVLAEYRLAQGCRIDVLIEGYDRDRQRWVVVVEAKIDADEQQGQLRKYDQALDRLVRAELAGAKVLRVFLSEDGRAGVSSARGSLWGRMSYKNIAKEFLAVYPELRSCEGHPFLRIYLAGLFEEVCGIACGGSMSEIMDRNEAGELERLLVMVK